MLKHRKKDEKVRNGGRQIREKRTVSAAYGEIVLFKPAKSSAQNKETISALRKSKQVKIT